MIRSRHYHITLLSLLLQKSQIILNPTLVAVNSYSTVLLYNLILTIIMKFKETTSQWGSKHWYKAYFLKPTSIIRLCEINMHTLPNKKGPQLVNVLTVF